MSSSEDKFEIPTVQLEQEFQDHLDLDGNQRIIFSAPFGSGKTYFLKKFFNDSPSVFHLYPVNYSVSRNEDIFELIKYDLLFKLLEEERGVDFERIDYNLSQRGFLALNDPSNDDILEKVISFIPKVGTVLSSAYKNLPKLIDSIAPRSQKDEKGEAKKATKEAQKTKGSIFENNDLTGLIRELIAKTKNPEEHKDTEQEENESNKTESVLILDDLDRIDPEHIFRLLNVFAAHFDINEEENKFGFDKVVFVCDIDNIRKIFANKYGQDADFSGYIDKFYSREVFVFDNSEMISKFLDSIVQKIKFKAHKYARKQEHDDVNFKVLKFILEALVSENCINLRALLKYVNNLYIYQSRILDFEGNEVEKYQINFFSTFEFLHKLFGNSESFLSALKKISRIKFTNDLSIGSFLMIIDWKSHQYGIEKTAPVEINNKNYYYKLKATNRVKLKFYGSFEKAEYSDSNSPAPSDDYFQAVYLAAQTLVDQKVLR